MALKLLEDKGYPIEKQAFTWREIAGQTISKLDDDAFTRVRVILMNGIETESVLFQHSFARANFSLREPLAVIRRVEKHQQTAINWLLGADHSPVETTIAYEQAAIEVTADVAQREPDPYLAQVYRFGLLEDFDHLYRFTALLDRLEGKDANNILQNYTDIRPGRPTALEHRYPLDDLRKPYDRESAAPLSKLHALTITAAEQQTQNYYNNIGPLFSDPVARALYAEIAAIEEQHVTQYESLLDPAESWMERWLLHEANEAYNYFGCLSQERNPHVRALWERFLDYELGHLHAVSELFKRIERRDPAEVLPETLPDPIEFKEHREFVRETLRGEVNLRANRTAIVPLEKESELSRQYRGQMNAKGSPTEIVAAGYQWNPGTELNRKVAA